MSKAKRNSQVEKSIQTIESRYEIGKEVLKQCGQRSPHGVIAELAEKHGVPRDTCQKLRALASKEAGYSKTELNRWFRRFRAVGFSLTITHFIKLVSVPKGTERDRLTELAIEDRWSTHRLQAEILALQGRRQVGGRKPTVVVGDQFEDEFTRVLWSWDRWLAIHLEANKQLSPKLRKETKALQRTMGKVLRLLNPE
jgi:hypothetical protein